MTNGLVSYLDSLKKIQPVKCQRCECLEIVLDSSNDWIVRCSESECYYSEEGV